MSSAKTSSKIPWSGLVVAALTVALLWWFVKDLSLDELRNAFATANLWLIAAAVLTTLQTYLIRAWRWQVMLAPIGTVRFGPAFRTTIIGFTATFLLPARVGEVLRPYLLAKQERLSVSATFATIIVERALDLTAVLLLFACSMPFLGVDVGAETRWAGGLAAVAALVGLGVLFACAGHPERLGLLVDRLTGWLPTRIAAALAHEGININDIEVMKVREGEGGTLRLGFDSVDCAQRAVKILGGTGFQARQRE